MNQADANDVPKALHYLRQDVFAHNGMIGEIENNMPPVPRQVWTATDERGEVNGVLVLDEFEERISVQLTADSEAAVAALLSRLDPLREYQFIVHSDLWPWIQPLLADVAPLSEHRAFRLAALAGGLATHEAVRRLTSKDAPMLERFPASDKYREPPLSLQVQWAEQEPSQYALFGWVQAGELLSYVQFAYQIDAIWEIGMIRTRPADRGKGYARGLLSHASREMLGRGLVLLYTVAADNLASLRTAQAAGYEEAFRTISCNARVNIRNRVFGKNSVSTVSNPGF